MTKLPVPEKVFDQHIAVLGKTRSGKSSVLRLLVENLLHRKQPVCVVDPKGDWWGLKLSKDGKGPGYPVVIFGGEHADVPINEHAGGHVAELFATGNRPCLIDLGGWMPGERTRFWVEFASSLFRHTKGNRWLVVDEVHNFCPKGKILDVDAGKALHWSNRLASEGLGKGLATLSASQRPQKVHNDFLTSCETLIAMRVLHPSDREAIADWVKGCGDAVLGKQVLDTLSQLERGEGWAWSPEAGFGPVRVKFPLFSTYDSFRAQSVQETKALKGWAEVDLDDVKEKLAAYVEEAKANDPRELKQEVARLRAELAKKVDPVPPPPPERVEVPALDDDQVKSLQEVVDDLRTVAGGIARTLEFRGVSPAFGRTNPPPTPTASPTRLLDGHERVKSATKTAPPVKHDDEENGDAGAGFGPKEQKILDTVLMFEVRGIEPNAERVARWMGVHHDTGAQKSRLAWLRANGYLDGWVLTEQGRGAARRLPTGYAAALTHLFDKKGQPDAGKQRMLKAVVDHGPFANNVALAEHLGVHFDTGTFKSNLARLRLLGLVTERRPIASTPAVHK